MKKDISELVKKYEEQLASGKSIYFDADEFDEIADYYDQQEDFERAGLVIEAGLRIHPESDVLLLKQARYLVYDGDYEQALKILNRITTEYDIDNYLLKMESLLQLGRPDEAYSLVKEILENETDFLDHALAEIAFVYLDTENFDLAILYFEKSLEYNPENLEALGELAYAYEMVSNFEKAVETNNRILDIDSYSYNAWINLGRLYSMNSDYSKAIDAFDFALTIDESDNNVWKLKAHCLTLNEQGKEAIPIFKKLIEEEPEDSTLYFLLAECYFSLNMYDEALKYLNEFQAKEVADTIDILSKKASIYLELGEYDEVLALLENAHDESSESAEANLILGEVKYRMGEYDEAEKYLIKAYELNKDNPEIVDRLAVINIKKEDYQKALEYSKELLDMEPYSLLAKQRLALLYFELDNEGDFNELLDSMGDDELTSLFDLVYDNGEGKKLGRKALINYLREARECRILFKNLKH